MAVPENSVEGNYQGLMLSYPFPFQAEFANATIVPHWTTYQNSATLEPQIFDSLEELKI